MISGHSIRRACIAGLALLGACASGAAGVPPEQIPTDLRSDYQVFAMRCSKCHSLSRPLQSGITDERHWANYIARMRLQPASGITAEEAPRILRYLAFYSRQRQPQTR
jgi:hypothetical protein